MSIKVCVAGVTGWTGSAVAKAVLASSEFELVGALARQRKGEDVGLVLGKEKLGINITDTLAHVTADVLVDYTEPSSVKERIISALHQGMRVVIGTSGLGAQDYVQIHDLAVQKRLGVIAAGNFSITAALAKHFALLAARHLPSWEIVDYAHADKVDAPSGTTRELAEELSQLKAPQVAVPLDKTIGFKDARGTKIGSTQVHSVRLPSYVIAFETLFGLPNERLTIRHDAGTGADPYVGGTLLAAQRVMNTTGLVRGLVKLIFREA